MQDMMVQSGLTHPSEKCGTSSHWDKFTVMAYEGASKSSHTELITKCMLAFGDGYCCHLQSSPLLSLCNESRVSATEGSIAKTDTLGTCVG
jgi:hypothetical protein